MFYIHFEIYYVRSAQVEVEPSEAILLFQRGKSEVLGFE